MAGLRRERPVSQDRGSRRGAKWFIVADRTLYAYATAKAHGIEGKLFRSGKEAKRWLVLLDAQDAGRIRNLQSQVRFSLQTRNPAGLMVHVMNYVADFTYEELESVVAGSLRDHETWTAVVEDVKPSGMMKVGGRLVPFREDTFRLKKKFVEAQYGITIRET